MAQYHSKGQNNFHPYLKPSHLSYDSLILVSSVRTTSCALRPLSMARCAARAALSVVKPQILNIENCSDQKSSKIPPQAVDLSDTLDREEGALDDVVVDVGGGRLQQDAQGLA